MAFAQGAGAQIHYRVSGDATKPALVLLNSIGTDMSLWDACLPALEAAWHVARIDTRGHGRSEAPAGDYTLALLADDVRAVLRDAGIAKARIAGVSLGGMIAMQLALDHPAVVEGLALICTSATMDAGAWEDRIRIVRNEGLAAIADMAIGRFLSPDFRQSHPARTAQLRASLIAGSADGYAGAGAAIRDMALAERLPDIATPTLIVTGDKDISTPFDPHGQLLLERIPGAVHHQIASAHLPPIENSERLCALLNPRI